MNALLLPHHVQWVTAAPLWPAVHQDRAVMQRPAILRFTNDRFMDELIAELGTRPEELHARSVNGSKPSYRERAPGEDDAPTTEHLKLYQPAHGHFYLVASSLVCRLPGLPDHAIDREHDERAGFVIRRLDGNDELALVGTGEVRAWQRLERPEKLAPGEELLPMFQLGLGEPGRRRRLLAGLIPVARQEELQGAPLDESVEPPPKSLDDLLEDIKSRVTHAIQLLKELSPSDLAVEKETSRFILLDLADFLHRELPAVWSALGSPAARPARDQGALAKLLDDTAMLENSPTKLSSQLKIAWQEAAAIVAGTGGSSLNWNLRHLDVDTDVLQAGIGKALNEVLGPAPTQPPPVPAASTLYVVRCVYRRHHCGPLKPELVSTASESFALAPFFDPDAPARPIRISLPIDPSISGLRKFRKNVTIVMSGALRQKLNKTGVLKNDKLAPSGEFDCGGLSFSIPIITICALVLLFVMLILLNLVFFWLPFVKICLPKLRVE
jgi:hypothetical protein